MIVAVTGASGFIGGAAVRRLVKKGFLVRAIVRTNSNIAALAGLGVSVHRVDFQNSSSMAEALSGVDAVIHTAGPGLVECLRHNLPASEAVSCLVRALEVANCRNFVYLSSVKARAPQVINGALSSPTDIYGRKKHAEEVKVQVLQNISWCIVRAGAVFGPGDRKSLPIFRIAARKFIPILSAKAKGAFSMTSIDDLCEALIQACTDNALTGRILEIGSDPGVSWNELMHMLAADNARFITLPMWLIRMIGFFGSSLALLNPNVSIVGPRIRDLTIYNWEVLPELQYRPPNAIRNLNESLRQTQDWYRNMQWTA